MGGPALVRILRERKQTVPALILTCGACPSAASASPALAASAAVRPGAASSRVKTSATSGFASVGSGSFP